MRTFLASQGKQHGNGTETCCYKNVTADRLGHWEKKVVELKLNPLWRMWFHPCGSLVHPSLTNRLCRGMGAFSVVSSPLAANRQPRESHAHCAPTQPHKAGAQHPEGLSPTDLLLPPEQSDPLHPSSAIGQSAKKFGEPYGTGLDLPQMTRILTRPSSTL